ncbi:MAG: S1 family peptidase, partial [Steroidobacteraceae bacterium]
IGTAFAIGPNRYVTASHVLAAGLGSQFGPPALRDAAGNVYAIDQVLKYSNNRDFAVFSLRTQPKGVQPLAVGSHPELNDPVFAVGNALGEGIVTRDGIYTSDTPEELNGEWKWLRFSAAASPGNSGGPLVDQQGRVIGIVLRKTEAENLNYALPFDQVAAAPDNVGKLESRTPIRSPVMDASETMNENEQFALPKSLPDFYATVQGIAERELAKTEGRLITDNTARLFPHGDGSDRVLHQAPSSPFPRLIHQNRDGIWGIENEKPQVFQLDDNGSLRIGGGTVRLRAPENISLASLYSDSKLLMDLVLKGFPLHRQVGTESVNVTSLGKAQELGTYTDDYGRVWQIRSWAVPYADIVLSGLCLPTPEGYDLVLIPIATGLRSSVLTVQEELTNYLYLTMTGTLARWQEYLQLKDTPRPKVFGTFSVDIDPAKYVRFRSKRFDLDVTPDLVKLDKDSEMEINFGYYKDAGAVVWDVSALIVQEALQKANWAEVVRASAPEPSLPQGFQDTWNKIQGRQFPFNAMITNQNDATRIETVDGAAADQKVHYLLLVDGAGEQPQAQMGQKLMLMRQSFKELEQ